MTRKENPAKRMTLYRVVDIAELREGLAEKYVEQQDQFTLSNCTVQSRPALLLAGVMVTPLVRWAGMVYSFTGQQLNLGGRTPAAALLIHDSDTTAWALTFGMGFHLLDPSHVDQGFGQRIAIRTANADNLTSLSRTTLDQRPRVDRLSIPSGAHVRGFGLGDVGELVTRLVGQAHIDGLTHGNESFSLRGADSLSIPLGRQPETLLEDLDLLSNVLASPAHPILQPLEQLLALKAKDERIPQLRKRLATDLDGRAAALGLSWPSDLADEYGPVSSFLLTGAGRGHNGEYDGMITLDHLRAPVAEIPEDKRLKRLESMRVQLLSDADEAASGSIPAIRWLAYETPVDGSHFCLHNGRWYLMKHDYAEHLRRRAQGIFDRPPPITLPDWTSTDQDEAAYNRRVADEIGGLCLDRRLIHTEAHPHGIEVCDILAPDGTLIHVKRTDESASASHLIAQILVSAESMLHDEQAHREFQHRVIKAGGTRENVPSPIRRVLIGMARDRKLDAHNLFTFTQVTLARGTEILQRSGVEVYVTSILRTANSLGDADVPGRLDHSNL